MARNAHTSSPLQPLPRESPELKIICSPFCTVMLIVTTLCVALLASAVAGQPCAFDGEERYISRSDLDACLNTVPFNETWRSETLQLVRAARA